MPFYRKKWFWVLAFMGLAAGLLFLRCSQKAVEVGTGYAKRQLLEITVTSTSTGTIKSDTEVKVAAQRAGMISAVHVLEGDIVRKGDVIVELDTTEAGINLERARAAHSRAEAVLDKLKASHRALEAEVKSGIASAEARFEEAGRQHERYIGLYDKGFISKVEFDTARTGYEVAKAEREAALSGKAKGKAMASEIAAQTSALKEAGEAVKLARLEYGYSFLKAPITGIVTSLPVKLGEMVGLGYLAAELIATESLYIEALIDEADVGRVNKGQEVFITMDAYPEKTLAGRVYMISPVVLGEKHETRTFEVRTKVVDEDVELKPGMSADVEIVVGRAEDTLAVQSQAVIERDGKRFVYVKDGSRARLREVRIGLFNWTLTEITDGLKASEEVIITPDVKGLKDGVRVELKK